MHCLLRFWLLHIFLKLLHEYFLQKQFIHKLFQIIKESRKSSFKTWPVWSGACPHSTLCCRRTAGGAACASHFWPGHSHLGYWTPMFLNIIFKKKRFFRDLVWKANARLLSLSLCKGNLKGPSQKSLKQHSHFRPGKCIPAVLTSCLGKLRASCLVWQFGDNLTGTIQWKPLDFHACPGRWEGLTREGVWVPGVCSVPKCTFTMPRCFCPSQWPLPC